MTLFIGLTLRCARAACAPGACRATGRGLQPSGMRVKQVGDFKVDTRNAGSGELKVLVKGPSEYSVRPVGRCVGPDGNVLTATGKIDVPTAPGRAASLHSMAEI